MLNFLRARTFFSRKTPTTKSYVDERRVDNQKYMIKKEVELLKSMLVVSSETPMTS